MAAGDILVYEKFKENQMSGIADAIAGVGATDLAGSVTKLMLCTNTYTPAVTTDVVVGSGNLAANEVTGTGYTAGGETVSVTVVNEAGFIRVKIASDLLIAQNASGFTNARYWVLYAVNGTPADANDKLICYGDFGSDKSIVTGSLTIDFENTNGGTLFEY